MDLSYKTIKHKNNFDFLRLLFAIFVIITHSYSLSGITENDFINRISNNQTSFSYLGVRGFFVISGYLIFQSMLRSSSLGNYFWKRFLRLFPALIVVLLITVSLGFLVYNSSLHNYLLNTSMWTYIPNNLSLYNLQFGITDVLGNKAINGSLWTIRYEFSFYIILSIFFIVRKNEKLVRKVLIVTFILLLVSKFFLLENLGKIGHTIGSSMSLNLGLFFLGGSLLASLCKLPQK